MLSRVELASRFPVFGKFSSLLSIHGSHRGGCHWGKENTLEVYRRAVYQAQTEILEIDIWKTIDEQLILNHDGIIQGHSVTKMTLENLRKFDRNLITLDELLMEFQSMNSLVYFFDMKDIQAIRLTLEKIRQYKIEDRVIFGAVDRQINLQLQKDKFSFIPICADIETMKKFLEDYRQNQINENYQYEHDILGFFLESNTRNLLNKNLIKTIHHAGKILALVGTLLDNQQIQKEMIELGVDILFTDRPDILRQTLNEYISNN